MPNRKNSKKKEEEEFRYSFVPHAASSLYNVILFLRLTTAGILFSVEFFLESALRSDVDHTILSGFLRECYPYIHYMTSII